MLEGVFAMVCLDQGLGVHMFYRFPRIVTVWVPLPLDQVLESAPLPKEAMIYDGFDFVFRVLVYKIWGWSGVIGSVSSGLPKRSQQRGVEDVMNSP